MMTERLKEAFVRSVKLPPKQQDLTAELVLDFNALPWAQSHITPHRQLEEMAEEALEDIRHDKTNP